MSEPTTPNEREALEWIVARATSARTTKSRDMDDWNEDMYEIGCKARAALSRTDPAVASTAAVEAVESIFLRIDDFEEYLEIGDHKRARDAKIRAKEEVAALAANLQYVEECLAHPPRESGDAERYRAFFDSGLPVCFMGQEFRSKEECDKAIDAAIRSEGGGG